MATTDRERTMTGPRGQLLCELCGGAVVNERHTLRHCVESLAIRLAATQATALGAKQAAETLRLYHGR